ncbi:hypothetical protein B5E58_11285 [Tyzzerella sp. An114]|nr:hypothetical protein B5E58_11285 [Tyzzerella sp. An114]
MTMKNKKRIAISAAALAGCLVIGGTFAWFSTTDKVANKFDMDAFDVAITEDFDQNPDIPLVPGADITKNVTVTNSGNMDVVVRVKLEEMLKLFERYTEEGNDKLKVTYKDNATGENYEVPVVMSDEMIAAYGGAGYTGYTSNVPTGVTVLRKITQTGDNIVYSYVAYKTDNKQVVKVTPVGDSKETPDSFTAQYAFHTYKNNDVDGATAIHGKDDATLNEYYGASFHENAVVLNFAANVDTNGDTIDDGANWYLAEEDGYFYYTKVLEGNTVSDPLLESVYIKEEAANALQGAHYELTPIMEATQAEKAAVEGNWTSNYGNETIRNHINGLLAE